MESPDTETLGQRVRRLRKARGLSCKQLSQRLGISRSAVVFMEGKATVGARSDTIQRYADALQVSPGYLLTGVERQHNLSFEEWLCEHGQLESGQRRRLIADIYNMAVRLERLQEEKAQ